MQRARALRAQNRAYATKGASLMAELKIAEALKEKSIYLLPKNEGTVDFHSTDMNDLMATALARKKQSVY